MDLMKNVGQRAKEFRTAKGWNTSQMARAVGTSRQNIEHLEARGNIVPRYIAQLAKAMGMTVDDLVTPGVAIKPHVAAEPHASYGTETQPAYSAEALALAWLLDQVTDRMAKIRANHDATQAILNVLQQLDAPPTATPAAPSNRAKRIA